MVYFTKNHINILILMKKHLIILFFFITISVNFSVFAYEIGDFIKLFNEEPERNVRVTVNGTDEKEKNKKVKKILLDVLETHDAQDLFNHVSVLTGTIKEINYDSCCWFTSGIFDIFDLPHLIPNTLDQGFIIKINNVLLNEKNYSFFINIEEYCDNKQIKLLLGCRSGTRNATYGGEKISRLMQGKKNLILKTLYSL